MIFMMYPAHGEVWTHFDRVHPLFASEPQNVRLALCSDGFVLNSNFGNPYSCWPIVVTPYDLPRKICMKDPYIFLFCIILGLSNPKAKIYVFLQPLAWLMS